MLMLGPFFSVEGPHCADINAGPNARHRKWQSVSGSSMQQTAVTATPTPAAHQKVDAAVEFSAWCATTHPAKQTDHKQAKYCAGARTRLHATNQCNDNSGGWSRSADRSCCDNHAADRCWHATRKFHSKGFQRSADGLRKLGHSPYHPHNFLRTWQRAHSSIRNFIVLLPPPVPLAFVHRIASLPSPQFHSQYITTDASQRVTRTRFSTSPFSSSFPQAPFFPAGHLVPVPSLALRCTAHAYAHPKILPTVCYLRN